MTEPSTQKLGLWAAGASAAFALAYTAGQLLEWLGLLGSHGGPNASSTPLGIAVLLIPSLLLGPAWVVTLAALHEVAPVSRRGFSVAALALATIYAALTGLVYFVQLTFVGPRLASGAVQGIELLLFVPYQSFLFAIDLWGYSLMCASALFAAYALAPEFKRARPWLVLTGLLTPALAFQMFVPQLIWAGAIWGFSFPLAALFLARGFAGLERAA
jgi:hypothetical protein